MSVSATTTQLDAILTNRRKFKVGTYQRKYEWTRHQMAALIDDLHTNYVASKAASSAYHFIGTFIFHKKDRPEIIDGQQRLTSISIILAVARDMVTADEKLRTTIQSYIEDPGTTARAQPMRRIEHHRGDEGPYGAIVVARNGTRTLGEPPPNEAHVEPLPGNTWVALEKLAFLSSDAEIDKFITHVMHQCTVIELSVDGADDAFRIFATVNARGQPLRDQDILRVTLIEEAISDPIKRRVCLRRWDAAEKLLGSDRFERYLRLKRYAAKETISETLPFAADYENVFGSTPEEVAQFLEHQLEKEAEHYSGILRRRITWRHNRASYPLEFILYSMRLARYDEWMAIATNIFAKFGTAGARDLTQLTAWLRKLEALVWRWEFDATNRHVVANRRARFANILRYQRNHNVWDIRNSDIELSDKEVREMRQALAEPIDAQWPPLRGVLLRIEQALRNGKPVWDLDGDYNIEHVVPRSGGGAEWRAQVGATTDDELRTLALYLGNLCFVTRELNKAMADKPFAVKHKLAAEAEAGADSIMAEELCAGQPWTRELIGKRTKRYADRFTSAIGV